jgi:hypothetical protein
MALRPVARRAATAERQRRNGGARMNLNDRKGNAASYPHRVDLN